MEVKIYREKENEALILDEAQLQKYRELTAKLGLSNTENSQTVPSVYVSLNFAMAKQLQAVCPVYVAVEDYTKSTIPLDVLVALDYCKGVNMYEGYQVWYNDVEPDPLLIGWNYQNDRARENQYSWQKNYYLIARWGDCALELPQLLKLGYDKIVKELSSKSKLGLEKLNSISKNPEIYADIILAGKQFDVKIDLSTTADKDLR